MKNRTKKYFISKKCINPIHHHIEVKQNPDKKIDDDFPGFPDGQSKPAIINPRTKLQRDIAATKIKDGEKMTKDEKQTDEQLSDSSGGAFEATEQVKE